MSSYTQPTAYSNGSILNSNTIKSNEESLKDFVNQEIIASDIATGKLEQGNIARGSIVQNNAEFQTSHISGIAELQDLKNRSYATSTTKNNNQTASIQWQDIANSGCLASCHSTADIIINMYVRYAVASNTALAGNEGQGNQRWQNEIQLRRINVETGAFSNFAGSDNYCWEPTGTPGDTKNPLADLEGCSERSLMLTYRIANQAKGEYFFTATVNPHNETGYTTVKSMTAEVFYI